jgi:rubrerythrin
MGVLIDFGSGKVVKENCWMVGRMTCLACQTIWTGYVHAEKMAALECPNCHEKQGIVNKRLLEEVIDNGNDTKRD